MAIKGGWTSIEQVPLLAWYRLKANQKDVFPIRQINMQHIGGGYSPGLPPPKASPAVMINEMFWRPEELTAAFDVSIDGITWQDCIGEVGGRGSLSDRLARLEAAQAANKGKLSDDVAAALKEMIQVTATNVATMTTHGQEIAALKDAFGRLVTGAEQKSPAGNFEQVGQTGSEPPKDPPKSNPGAKPPEQKKP